MRKSNNFFWLWKQLIRFVLLYQICSSNWVLAVGDAQAGKLKVTTCAACHGEDGNSTSPIYPKLAGQHAEYLLSAMQEYQKGSQQQPTQRTSATAQIMYAQVQNLTTQDLEDIAAYYSAQQVTPGEASRQYYERGRQLYLGGDVTIGIPACAACHGPAGDGNALAKFPKISAQNMQYVHDQLQLFKTGERKNAMMSVIALNMSDADMQAVSSYISGLHE